MQPSYILTVVLVISMVVLIWAIVLATVSKRGKPDNAKIDKPVDMITPNMLYFIECVENKSFKKMRQAISEFDEILVRYISENFDKTNVYGMDVKSINIESKRIVDKFISQFRIISPMQISRWYIELNDQTIFSRGYDAFNNMNFTDDEKRYYPIFGEYSDTNLQKIFGGDVGYAVSYEQVSTDINSDSGVKLVEVEQSELPNYEVNTILTRIDQTILVPNKSLMDVGIVDAEYVIEHIHYVVSKCILSLLN